MEEKKSIPEGFTLKLALVDAIPVVEFSVSMMAIASKFKSALFALGACCSTLAGCGKVLWKILLAVKKEECILFEPAVPVSDEQWLCADDHISFRGPEKDSLWEHRKKDHEIPRRCFL